ncbi:MAG: acyl-CoA thioesterase [Bacteroidetes bacterium]|nr:MAG: acyl-CoA thioesterase [Bacteroidota bacterium]PTM13501.1 MAG: acyl-CoA thioesterase [Bacteroidota bacterium]
MNELQGKRVTASATVMTEMIMPNDANPMGNLMGGNLLRWMDIGCGICAGKHCEKHVVTASVDHVSFNKAIRVGDVITLEASITRAFRTSVEVFVEVYASDIKGHNPRRCNAAYYTFVALDQENGKPVAVPPIIPVTEIEQQRYDSAPRRREMRLILAGRLKPENAPEVRALFETLIK